MLWFERMAKNIVKIPKDAYQYAIDYAQKLFEYRDMETLKKNFQGGNVLITDPYTGKPKYVLIRLNEVISGNVGMEVNVLDDKRYLLNISAKAIENYYKILQEKNWSPASLQSALREWQGHFVHEFIHVIDQLLNMKRSRDLGAKFVLLRKNSMRIFVVRKNSMRIVDH